MIVCRRLKLGVEIREFYSKAVAVFRSHPVKLSIIYNLAILYVAYSLNALKWESSDDFTISQLLMGTPGEFTPFVLSSFNYYLALGISWFQQVFPITNWLSILDVLAVLITFIVMTSYLIQKTEDRFFVICLLFPLIFESRFYVTLHYTRSAFLYSYTGLLLVYRSIFDEIISYKKCFIKLLFSGIKLVLGIFLFLVGVMLRNYCFYISILYIGIFLFELLKDDMRAKRLRQNRQEYTLLAGCLIILSAITIVIITGHNGKYKQLDEESTWRAYIKARGSVVDYMPSNYVSSISNDEFIVSQNDYLMLRYGMMNDQYFSEDYFHHISLRLDSVERDREANLSVYVNSLLKYQQGRYTGQNSLIIIWIFFTVIAFIVSCSGKWFIVFSNMIGTLILTSFFLFTGRYPSYVEESILLISCFIYTVSFCRTEIAIQSDERLIKKRVMHFRKMNVEWLNQAVVIKITFIICLISSGISFWQQLHTEYKENIEDIVSIFSYASEDKQNFYVLDTIPNVPYPIIDAYGPFYYFAKGEWSNIVRVGNWDVEHPVRNIQKSVYGVDSVISSLITSNTKMISKKNNFSFDIYRTFFIEHYNCDYTLEIEQTYGDYIICSFQAIPINSS